MNPCGQRCKTTEAMKKHSKDYRLRILIQSLVWIPGWVAASSYSTVRLKTQPEPHECILLCISHRTQILWWSEQFSSSNRGCSFAYESCKTTQSHQWFFEPDGLCVVWVHPEAKQCETRTCRLTQQEQLQLPSRISLVSSELLLDLSVDSFGLLRLLTQATSHHGV